MKKFWLKLSAVFLLILVILIAIYFFISSPNSPLLTEVSQPENSATPFPTPAKPIENLERDMNLQAESDKLVKLFGLRIVPVYLKDEIINKHGTNTERGVAYTTCEEKGNPEIFVKKVFYKKANRKQLINILKHELTHAWQCSQDLTWGHDEKFYKKFRSVGGIGN